MKTKLHFFGTSYTEGGGFEFHLNKKLESIYGDLGEELTKFNFSFPGQLLKLIDKNKFEVYNHAKSGFGNDRLFREFYKVLDNKNFNVRNNIFFFEFSWLGREDYFVNKLNDYVICNSDYDVNENFMFDENNITVDYDYSTDEQYKIYKQISKTFSNFFKITKNKSSETQTMFGKIMTFLSLLEYLNIRYYFTESPLHLIQLEEKRNYKIYHEFFRLIKKEINFSNDYNLKISSYQFINLQKLTITDETEGLIENSHYGYIGNKLIAKYIYNRLIKDGIFDGHKKEIDLSHRKISDLKYL